MQIKVEFKNDSPTADAIRVYRSDTKFTKANLPAIYETIAGSATAYIDNNAPPDKTQFYMFGIVKGSYEVFSLCIEASSLTSSGPGPQNLIRGDMDCGYYGTFPATDFVSYGALLDQFPALTGTRYANNNERWMKFAYKGKILIIPEKPMISNAAWNTIYNAGLVYGVAGPGPRDVNSLAPVDQLKIANLRSYDFIVRLPTIIPSNASPAAITVALRPSPLLNNTSVFHPTGGISATPLGDNEWDDLISKTMIWPNIYEKGSKFDNKVSELSYDVNASWIGMVDVIGQSCRDANNVLARGSQTVGYSNVPAYLRVVARTSGYAYRPVLEMVR